MARRRRARSSAGRRRASTACERARGEAVYTADLQLPGMLHTAVLRSPARARARRRASTSRRRSHAPGVHAAIGPGDLHAARRRAAASRAPRSPRSAPTRYAQARAALAAIDVEWEQLEPLLDPDEAVARGVAARRRAARPRARRLRAGSRRGRRRRRGRVPDAGRPAQLDGDAPGGRAVGRRRARGVHLDAVHLGRARRGRERLGLPPDKVRVVCHYMGGGFGSKNGAGRLHVHRGRAGEAHRPARPLRAHAPRGEPRDRQPQRDHPAADDRREARTAR